LLALFFCQPLNRYLATEDVVINLNTGAVDYLRCRGMPIDLLNLGALRQHYHT
jgi:hypothetical protein